MVVILYRVRISIMGRSLNKFKYKWKKYCRKNYFNQQHHEVTYVIIFFVVVSRGRVGGLVAIVGSVMSFMHNRFVFIVVVIVDSVMAVSVMSRFVIIN